MSTDLVVVVVAAAFGLLIGSFLNVVIYRVPRGESVVSPPSACPGCGTQIAAYDNIPVISWLLLRGRCRSCAMSISARYPLVELLTGAVFGVVTWHVGLAWELPAWLYLAGVGVALTMIDIDTKRLPDRLVLPSYVVGLALLALPALVEGRWDDYLRGLLGMAALFGFYFMLAFIHPAGMGGGDVKLAGVLGLYLGWLSWGALLVGAFLGFLLGALVSVVLIAVAGAGRKTAIPFGPFMLAGTLLGLLVGEPIVTWYLGTASG